MPINTVAFRSDINSHIKSAHLFLKQVENRVSMGRVYKNEFGCNEHSPIMSRLICIKIIYSNVKKSFDGSCLQKRVRLQRALAYNEHINLYQNHLQQC